MTKINVQDWMNASQTLAVIDALGGCDQARFVGGCVRNAIINAPVSDIDIATKHTPGEVVKRLSAKGIKAIPTGIDHGTITAVIDKKTFEITTLRRDIKADGRHAEVEYSTCWTEDAKRRDFTMNTLLVDTEGNIYDPLDTGLNDLGDRRVIFVGTPENRIKEDVLRILRFFRFHAIYGTGEPDAAALKACAAHADLIPNLSKERITQEYLKILSADKAREALTIMHDHNVLTPLTNVTHQGFEKLSMIGRLLVVDENIKSHQAFLALSNAQKKEFAAILKATKVGRFDTETGLKETLYYHGQKATRQAYLISNQDNQMLEAIIEDFEIPTFPTTGEDLIKQGYEQGRELGEKLRQLEKEWVDNGFK